MTEGSETKNKKAAKTVMNTLITIFMSGGFSTILCAGLVWLFRTWIGERMKSAIRYEYDEKLKGVEHTYGEKLESHKAQLQVANNAKLETLKAQLQMANDTELEKLKAQLQVTAAERNIKLTNIFERQATVIATLFKNLLALLDATQSYQGISEAMSTEDKQKLEESFAKAKYEFTEHFVPNEIFVPKSTAKLIHRLALTQSQVVNFHKRLDHYGNLPPTNSPSFEASLKRQLEAMEKLERDIPIILEALKDSFQELLGIEDKTEEAE